MHTALSLKTKNRRAVWCIGVGGLLGANFVPAALHMLSFIMSSPVSRFVAIIFLAPFGEKVRRRVSSARVSLAAAVLLEKERKTRSGWRERERRMTRELNGFHRRMSLESSRRGIL